MKRKIKYKKINLKKIELKEIELKEIIYLFEEYNKTWENYMNSSEIDLYISNEYEEFNIFYDKKRTYYLFKNKKCVLLISYDNNGLYSSLRIIEKNILKSYVLMNEKLELLIKETEDRKNKILNFNPFFF